MFLFTGSGPGVSDGGQLLLLHTYCVWTTLLLHSVFHHRAVHESNKRHCWHSHRYEQLVIFIRAANAQLCTVLKFVGKDAQSVTKFARWFSSYLADCHCSLMTNAEKLNRAPVQLLYKSALWWIPLKSNAAALYSIATANHRHDCSNINCNNIFAALHLCFLLSCCWQHF